MTATSGFRVDRRVLDGSWGEPTTGHNQLIEWIVGVVRTKTLVPSFAFGVNGDPVESSTVKNHGGMALVEKGRAIYVLARNIGAQAETGHSGDDVIRIVICDGEVCLTEVLSVSSVLRDKIVDRICELVNADDVSVPKTT